MVSRFLLILMISLLPMLGLSNNVDEKVFDRLFNTALQGDSREKESYFLSQLTDCIVKNKDSGLAENFLLSDKIYDYLKLKLPDYNAKVIEAKFRFARRRLLERIVLEDIKELLLVAKKYYSGDLEFKAVSSRDGFMRIAGKYDSYFHDFQQRTKGEFNIELTSYFNLQKTQVLIVFKLAATGQAGRFGFIIFKAVEQGSAILWFPAGEKYGNICS